MSDTLRTRIQAQVLDGILSMFSENDSVEMAAGYITDAVIEMLNLTTPVEYLSLDGQRRHHRVAGHYTVEVGE